MATKKKGIKAKKLPSSVVKKTISVPAGTRDILLHIKIGKGSGKTSVSTFAATVSPIEPEGPEGLVAKTSKKGKAMMLAGGTVSPIEPEGPDG